MPLVETINLCQRYGEKDILKNINIKVEQGEVLALIGPTGAGKTTLLRLIDLIDIPTAGKIIFDGVDTTKSAGEKLAMRRRMAFVLQKPVVFNMSVYDNITYGLKWRGVEKNNIRLIKGKLEREAIEAYLQNRGGLEIYASSGRSPESQAKQMLSVRNKINGKVNKIIINMRLAGQKLSERVIRAGLGE